MGGQTPAVPRRRLHPNPIALWAAGLKTPARFGDNDARLEQPGGVDTPQGQDGWNVGLDFANFRHLAELLGEGKFALPRHVCRNSWFDCGPIEPFQIHRLAISAHGGPGLLDVDGVFEGAAEADAAPQDDPRFLTAATVRSGRFERELALLERSFHDNAIVFWMGCRVAAGAPGEALLKSLSERWSGVRVAAISSIGSIDTGRQSKDGSQATSSYPGMRDTRYPNHKVPGMPARDYEYKSTWDDLKLLPWASERSRHVKVAFRGVLLTSKPEPPPVF
jgi:hypothetical protein